MRRGSTEERKMQHSKLLAAEVNGELNHASVVWLMSRSKVLNYFTLLRYASVRVSTMIFCP